jgi:hypothetical protein
MLSRKMARVAHEVRAGGKEKKPTARTISDVALFQVFTAFVSDED